ncbi:myosin class ii heavy chain [Ophiostoma piceae UAMH 11346]|uniref:Myosin class ii heavy chain n=1 Tax=Ophiostoma piceae (strain UAMH 11346) TaxID=1262450 RepID=S3BTR5_OPHP1|nr:myosin class ii heavy chain [Ophiostoma piceae UAMH 11346]
MPSSHTSRRSLTTSSSPPSFTSLPRAPAQEDYSGSRPPLPRPRRPHTPPSPRLPTSPRTPTSPAWSTASTADAGPSPSLPAIPAPRLPERVQALLRTPPPAEEEDEDDDDDNHFVTASWGSPYPRSDTSHLRLSSESSEPSDGSPIHHLAFHTPFLRPAPFFPDDQQDNQDTEDDELSQSDDDDRLSSPSFSLQASSALVSATVLANRARRPARGLTEDWIRQHTTGDLGSEARLWLSDSSSAGDSENSSLSGSLSGDDDTNVNTTSTTAPVNKQSQRKHSQNQEDDELSLRTPRANHINRQNAPRSPSTLVSPSQQPRGKHSAHHPRYQSSLETLRESDLNRVKRRDPDHTRDRSTSASTSVLMDSPSTSNGPEKAASNGSISEPPAVPAPMTVGTPSERPSTPTAKRASFVPLPSTPQQKPSPSGKREADVSLDPLGGEFPVAKVAASPRKTPRRVKKKLPWKGKSILVLLPIDENRGKPGKAPKPLSQSAVENMLRSWDELGYDIDGFDLDRATTQNDFDYYDVSSRSMSRPSWPDEGDVVKERAERKYPIQLPDLNAWSNYVQELNEAKLRALGVSFGDDEPPLPPSITPSAAAIASISRQNSVPIYPPLPFSPPIPTSSASSGIHGAQQFAFPGTFMPGAGGIIGSSAAQSPSIPSAASPIPFGVNSRFNNRQSISIPASHFQMPTTPGGFSPQALLLQNGLARGGSPSLAALSSVMSPTSPYTPDSSFTSPPLHQRHQSLQYPMMQYPQLQTSARASPRLQDLREIEEVAEEKHTNSKSPSKTPEPSAAQPFTLHNASFNPQNDIDSAEYHLEEQFREQFEHDRDYSPHGGKDAADAYNNTKPPLSQHARGLSVQFASNSAPIQRFRDDTSDGPLPLHHPRPHSRGHSLANAYYEPEVAKAVTAASAAVLENAAAHNGIALADDSYEIMTNPSNVGTPIQQGLDFASVLQEQQKQIHQRSFSTASNPWSENAGSFSGNKRSSMRQISHGSKASMSSLNVDAPEFKFNPGASSTFQPSFNSSIGSNGNANGNYLFGSVPNPSSEPFQPSMSIFQAGLGPNAPPSAEPSQFSVPSTIPTSNSGNKINVNAPTFSPGQSEFSFSSTGPKFRPDAPAFTPLHSFTDSLTSPIVSGNESFNGSNRPTSSIFGNIDLNIPNPGKQPKKSKAVPIIRPSSSHTPPPQNDNEDKENETKYDNEGHVVDDSRVKRARATPVDGEDDEVLFADSNNDLTALVATPSPSPRVEVAADKSADEAADEAAEEAPAAEVEAEAEAEVKAELEDYLEIPLTVAEATEEPEVEDGIAETEKEHDEDLAAEDTTMSSTVLSESTDAAKMPATTSPSEFSPLPSALPWTPFDFGSEKDMAEFNSARPMGDSVFRHKKSLSATAKPFVPTASFRDSVVSFAPDEFKDDDDEHILPTTESIEDEDKATLAATPVVAMESFVSFSSPPPPPPPATEKPKAKGLSASRYATSSPPPPPPKNRGLASSRYATSSPPPPVPSKDVESVFSEQQFVMPVPESDFQDELNAGVGAMDDAMGNNDYEPTFEEIDDIMRHLNEIDSAQGANKGPEPWQQTPTMSAAVIQPPVNLLAPSPSRSYQQLVHNEEAELELPQQPMQSTELEDPFVDQAHYNIEGPGHVSVRSLPSEWEGDFAGEEQLKLESRVNFFDGHVNDIVGGLLAARLDPLEKSLDRIQHAIAGMTRGTPSSRREYRSNSGEMKESDADDEDDEMPPVPRRSMSPRRDRRMEQIRAVVLDAFATHQSNNFLQLPSIAPKDEDSITGEALASILKSIADVKEHVGQVVESTATAREIAGEQEEDEHKKRSMSLETRVAELEERLRLEQTRTDAEITARRAADDHAAELRRQLELAETKIEVEMMNRSAFDQRVADLEDKLKHQEERTESELTTRQAAEDRLAEVERQFRIATEEEARLRDAVEERDDTLKTLSKNSNKERLRLAVLEASQVNSEQTHSDLQNRLNVLESSLRDKAQESRHWRAEAERAIDLSQRQDNDLIQTTTELRHLKRVVDTLGTQLEENDRLRDSWRSKFVSLQEDMSRAAREVAEESARFIKREQTLLARHEVLDAKLQAEARTRERLESELERLEGGERQAMRAVSECKRLETLLGELRTENHKLQQSSMRSQAEFEEARESAAREVQRTRDAMHSEIDNANHQVNVVRGDLEDQVSRARAQLDQVKLDSDTAKARLEMLLEEAESTKQTALDAFEASKRSALEVVQQRHQNEIEDMQVRYERQINNTTEDAQRAEQNLLERLSISTSKTEHLQERVAHLEEKLDIAREAAQAAAKSATAAAAKAAADATGYSGLTASAALQPAVTVKALHHGLGLPEKISPQALRESIFVLQEQLQQREQRIEELEQTLEKVDPEADVKIAKRDDEITWLRELLAVRHSDLKDIITALGREEHDPDRVRDAVIRLQANLQMEEQERERAMNGGSAIKLPTLAASIRDIAATPRVAQAVGPLAAAWGNWRKSNLLNSSPSAPTPSAAPAASATRRRNGSSTTATPSRRAPSSSISSRASRAGSIAQVLPQQQSGDSSFLSGLMTPPMSSRQALLAQQQQQQQDEQLDEQPSQPTAFSQTGRRYTGGRQPVSRRTSRTDNKIVAPSVIDESDSGSVSGPGRDEVATPPPTNFRRASRSQPVTPPMMHQSAYDSDAQADEFDDPSFYDD